jgi:CPA2 family monovalent cation:H+ antiporter-2
VAVPSETAVQRAADAAEALHPGITLVLRTHSEEQWESMRARGLASVYFGEDELASSMVQSVLPEGRA